jgi:hypothetical protein
MFLRLFAAYVSVISLFDVLCFPPFDGPIGEYILCAQTKDFQHPERSTQHE